MYDYVGHGFHTPSAINSHQMGDPGTNGGLICVSLGILDEKKFENHCSEKRSDWNNCRNQECFSICSWEFWIQDLVTVRTPRVRWITRQLWWTENLYGGIFRLSVTLRERKRSGWIKLTRGHCWGAQYDSLWEIIIPPRCSLYDTGKQWQVFNVNMFND